ncbi:hypothetical protein Tco_0875673 [Tanacetum coccineum]|uniref:Uncharacterized protein n=1 Tax=Tanacetum coccineum TaxID=301880 RepID=A0ABQ5BSY9_9ASTR
MVKGKREQSRSLSLKDKKEYSDEDNLTSESEDEGYAMASGKNSRNLQKNEEDSVRQPRITESRLQRK